MLDNCTIRLPLFHLLPYRCPIVSGDISFRYINYLKNLGPAPEHKQSSVTVCDINQAMLDVGKLRAQRYAMLQFQHLRVLCGGRHGLIT
jgi:hypothetical protein